VQRPFWVSSVLRLKRRTTWKYMFVCYEHQNESTAHFHGFDTRMENPINWLTFANSKRTKQSPGLQTTPRKQWYRSCSQESPSNRWSESACRFLYRTTVTTNEWSQAKTEFLKHRGKFKNISHFLDKVGCSDKDLTPILIMPWKNYCI